MKKYNFPITRVITGFTLFNIIPIIVGLMAAGSRPDKLMPHPTFWTGYGLGWLILIGLAVAVGAVILLMVGVSFLIKHTFNMD